MSLFTEDSIHIRVLANSYTSSNKDMPDILPLASTLFLSLKQFTVIGEQTEKPADPKR
jgi:hypothetical protein